MLAHVPEHFATSGILGIKSVAKNGGHEKAPNGIMDRLSQEVGEDGTVALHAICWGTLICARAAALSRRGIEAAFRRFGGHHQESFWAGCHVAWHGTLEDGSTHRGHLARFFVVP